MSLSPSAVHILSGGNIDLLIPELQMSQSSWRLRSFQYDITHTKGNYVTNAQLSVGNGEAHPADTSHVLKYTGLEWW